MVRGAGVTDHRDMSIAPIISGVSLLRQALEDSGTTGQRLAARTAERDRHEREDPAVQREPSERERLEQRALLGLDSGIPEAAPSESTAETTTSAVLKQRVGVPVKA